MESLDPPTWPAWRKNFNKPADYARRAGSAGAAQRLRHHVVHLRAGSRYARAWPSARWHEMREWPPVLPVFGQITPFPATPLYDRLEKEGRLTRPQALAGVRPVPDGPHAAEHDVPDEVQDEVREAWTNAYSPEANRRALDVHCRRTGALQDQPPGGAHLLPRHLFPAKGRVGVAEAGCAQPAPPSSAS